MSVDSSTDGFHTDKRSYQKRHEKKLPSLCPHRRIALAGGERVFALNLYFPTVYKLTERNNTHITMIVIVIIGMMKR